MFLSEIYARVRCPLGTSINYDANEFKKNFVLTNHRPPTTLESIIIVL